MKKYLFLFITMLTFSSLIFAQNKAAKVTIKIKDGTFTLNKLNVAKTWSIAPLLEILGNPSKQKDGFNKTRTYNNYGIVLFEGKNDKTTTGILSEFQVYFSAPEDTNSIMPSKPFFKGTFNFEGLLLNSETSFDKLKTKLASYEQSESYTSHNFRFAKNGLYLYFLFDETELRLVKVSIGKDATKSTIESN